MSGKVGDNVYRASGVIAAAAAAGGVSWQAVETGATFTAVAGNGYPVNTTAQACTVTLPAAASVGDEIIFTDYARNFDTNALTINQNSLNYQGATSPNPVYDGDGESIHIVYMDVTNGWIPTYDGGVAYETATTYSSEWLSLAGGGGGTGAHMGGGGGGGYRLKFDTENSGGGTNTESVLTLTEGVAYAVVVGAGGTAGVYATATPGGTGGVSTIIGTGVTISSAGGGGGGANDDDGVDGGSGGGGGSSGAGGSGTANQGYDGGTSTSASGWGAGGGGGSSAVGGGSSGNVDLGGDGGAGLDSLITGTSVGRGGGGGGGSGGGGTRGSASDGGGSNANGETNKGGGGSGSGSGTITYTGGSGVVILRMPDANYSGSTTGSPTVATDVGGSGETTIVFNSDGSYTG